MSLIVYAYRRDPQTKALLDIGPPARPHNDLAGFESWRRTVWGSDSVKRLGLTLLPSLSDGDIYAEGHDLDLLATEISALLDHLPHIAASTGIYEDAIRPRALNLREAVRLARQVADGTGGVYIG